MRPIDADVLKTELTRFYDNEVTAKRLIDEQPTVKAIPVEWLRTQISELLDDNETELASDIDWLIWKYTNEQEAR